MTTERNDEVVRFGSPETLIACAAKAISDSSHIPGYEGGASGITIEETLNALGPISRELRKLYEQNMAARVILSHIAYDRPGNPEQWAGDALAQMDDIK